MPPRYFDAAAFVAYQRRLAHAPALRRYAGLPAPRGRTLMPVAVPPRGVASRHAPEYSTDPMSTGRMLTDRTPTPRAVAAHPDPMRRREEFHEAGDPRWVASHAVAERGFNFAEEYTPEHRPPEEFRASTVGHRVYDPDGLLPHEGGAFTVPGPGGGLHVVPAYHASRGTLDGAYVGAHVGRPEGPDHGWVPTATLRRLHESLPAGGARDRLSALLGDRAVPGDLWLRVRAAQDAPDRPHRLGIPRGIDAIARRLESARHLRRQGVSRR